MMTTGSTTNKMSSQPYPPAEPQQQQEEQKQNPDPDDDYKEKDPSIDNSRTHSHSNSSSSSLPLPATTTSSSTPRTIPESTLDWSGPSDPANPHNWPLAKKIFHTIVPALIAFVCTFGSSVYVPGRSSVMQDLGVSSEVAEVPFVLYVLGLGMGPVIAAPCSE